MEQKEAEFLKRLQAIFREEAQEHVRALRSGLVELERASPAELAAVVEAVFREAHSLKGAARSVSLREVESVCQALEGVLAALKREEIALSPPLCDLVHRAVNAVARLIAAGAERTPEERAGIRELLRQLAGAAAGGGACAAGESARAPAEAPRGESAAPEAGGSARPGPPDQPGPAGSVKVPIAKLDPLLLQAEEMIALKLAADQRAADLREIVRELASWEREEPTRADRRDGAGERLHRLQGSVAAVHQALEQDHRQLRRMVDDHLEAVKQVLMLPIASVVEVLPTAVRELSRDQGKEVELVVHGAELEIDKRILEEIKDPILHLVRNCIDHGIGGPEERIARGKPRRGTITLGFSVTVGRRLEVLVADDGAGIDEEQVRASAIRAGVVSPEQALSLDSGAVLALVYRSGISTSRIITDISGRGLGLAIVREKVERLNGTVALESRPGRGTSFRLLLPTTLATFRGILVRVDEQLFVLPAAGVERAARVAPEEIRTVDGRETIRPGGEVLALVRLRDALGIPARGGAARGEAAPAAGSAIPFLVLASGEARIAFRVDEVVEELQVLVKGLGRQLRRVRNISGATILGSGRVVPVLNVADLMKSAVRAPAAVPAAAAAPAEAAPRGSVLVAEDSITSRTLIRNILETAGYRVAVAVDGADAWMQVRGGAFDLVVSDVDMPRMSGFELTGKIRGDRKLAELPVVLVTALESREDRERGIDVGANAYIVKSSFDQSNLLDVLRRLL